MATAPAGQSGVFGPAGSGPLSGWGAVWALLGVFLGGLALNLTPCVYPLIPITVSYFGGRSGRSRAELAAHGLLYVLGLALTNSLLGVLAAAGGGMMGALLQNPAVLLAVAGLLLAFAASLFGLWELRLPARLNRAASAAHAGYFGTFFMGLTLGVVAAPCLGPFVLGLLTWVAGLGSLWLGFAVFFVLSLGLGLPLFLLGLFSGGLDRLPRSGEWMLWVRRLMGWVLVGLAASFVRPLGPDWAGAAALSATALAAGVHLGFLDRTTAGFRAFGIIKAGTALAAVVLAAFWAASFAFRPPGVVWTPSSPDLLERARAEARPVVIDFSAAWCTPCRELEEVTFRDPGVVARSRTGPVMAKVDLTRGGDPVQEELLARFEVKGVPTVVFLDTRGLERRDLRLVDFLPPAEFAGRMDRLMRENP